VDGQTTPLFIQSGFAGDRNATWTTATVDLSAFAGQSLRLLFEAADTGTDGLVEAAIDDVRVYQAPSP
jgi:aminopeptidase S